MKKMYKVWAIWQICEAVILLAAGVLTIIFSDDPDLYKWIFLAIGAFIILDGVLRVLMPFFNKDPGDNSLFTGIFEVTFGIVIVLRSAAITEILMIFIATLLLVISPVAIADGIIRIKKKQETLFFPVLEFIAALLFITIGVIILVSIQNAQNVVLIVIGAILAILAIVEIAFTIKTLMKVKERDKKAQKKAEAKTKGKVVKKEVVEPVIVEEGEAFPVDKVK
ncbi:MAG TPA: hypothetical protein PLH17_00500 [Bacilli bacterium]|nr:hypothetical protein [Bacilli bacterium]HOF53143.1 hypothetical protein [Bacilli bacterium]HOR20294.1 hypothetical protein [Bacilli bacterium]HPK67273.1 hypothetical protein [Bacilli bacterium]